MATVDESINAPSPQDWRARIGALFPGPQSDRAEAGLRELRAKSEGRALYEHTAVSRWLSAEHDPGAFGLPETLVGLALQAPYRISLQCLGALCDAELPDPAQRAAERLAPILLAALAFTPEPQARQLFHEERSQLMFWAVAQAVKQRSSAVSDRVRVCLELVADHCEDYAQLYARGQGRESAGVEDAWELARPCFDMLGRLPWEPEAPLRWLRLAQRLGNHAPEKLGALDPVWGQALAARQALDEQEGLAQDLPPALARPRPRI